MIAVLPPWQDKLQTVLESWLGTPWVAGQQCRGRGVDCVRFVVAVLDELHGFSLPPIPRLPQDMSLHDARGAFRVARAIEERYPHELVAGAGGEPGIELVEPGDIVVVRVAKNSGPGHVLITGPCTGRCVSCPEHLPRPKPLWHACRAGVVRTSVRAVGTEIVRIWRPLQREVWQ